MTNAARTAGAECRGDFGISAWNGIAVARLCAPDGAALRYDLTTLLAALRGGKLPHCWFH
jgi:urease accessory protein